MNVHILTGQRRADGLQRFFMDIAQDEDIALAAQYTGNGIAHSFRTAGYDGFMAVPPCQNRMTTFRDWEEAAAF